MLLHYCCHRITTSNDTKQIMLWLLPYGRGCIIVFVGCRKPCDSVIQTTPYLILTNHKITTHEKTTTNK